MKDLFATQGIGLPILYGEGQRERLRLFGLRTARELEIGKAAEYLVCCDLLLKGYRACLSDQGLPYDVVIDLGQRIARVQVKGTMQPRNPQPGKRHSTGYFFNHSRAGKEGKKVYKKEDVDIFAFVAHDIKRVAYLHPTRIGSHSVVLRVPNMHYGLGNKPGYEFDDATIEKALADSLSLT